MLMVVIIEERAHAMSGMSRRTPVYNATLMVVIIAGQAQPRTTCLAAHRFAMQH
jgi:hypothetical protein